MVKKAGGVNSKTFWDVRNRFIGRCPETATIVTRNGEKPSELTIPRLKKTQMCGPIKEANAIEVSTFIGPKKPPMPAYEKKSLNSIPTKAESKSRTRRNNRL